MLVLKEVFHLYANILFNFCAFNYYIICALINSVLHYHAFSIFGYYSYDDKWEGFEIYSYWNTFRLFFICKELICAYNRIILVQTSSREIISSA